MATSKGLVQVVVAYSVDRLSRNQNHVGILMDEWNRQSVLVEFATEKFEDNAIGRFLISVQSFAAEFEIEKFKERSMRGISGRVKSGKPRPGPKAPYGYLWRDGRSLAMRSTRKRPPPWNGCSWLWPAVCHSDRSPGA